MDHLWGKNENVVLNLSDIFILFHPKCSLVSPLTLPFPLRPFTTHRGKERKEGRRRNTERFCGVRRGMVRAAPCPPASLWATGQASQQAELLTHPDRNQKLPAPSPGPFSTPDFSPEGSTPNHSMFFSSIKRRFRQTGLLVFICSHPYLSPQILLE